MGANPTDNFHPRLISKGAWVCHCYVKPEGILAGLLMVNRNVHPGKDKAKLVRPASGDLERLEFWVNLPDSDVEHHDILLTYAES